jgi:putative NIF3 family GTP cyclohydrolase 1 type 2
LGFRLEFLENGEEEFEKTISVKIDGSPHGIRKEKNLDGEGIYLGFGYNLIRRDENPNFYIAMDLSLHNFSTYKKLMNQFQSWTFRNTEKRILKKIKKGDWPCLVY